MSNLPLHSKVDEVQSLLNEIQSGIHRLPIESQNQVLDTLENFASQLRDRLKESNGQLNPSGTNLTNESAKNQAQESKAWLDLIMKQARLVAWKWDLVTGAVHWVTGSPGLLGFEASGGMNNVQTFFEMIPADERKSVIEEIEEAIKIGEAFYLEFQVIGRDGQPAWLSSSGIVEQDKSGHPIRVSGINQDITHHKIVEEKLHESEGRERAKVAELQAFMDAVPAMIWIARDPECREMVGNRYGYEFLEMWKGANISKTAPEEELAQQPYRNFKNGQEIPNNELPMQIAASTGVGASNYEFDLVFKNGEVRNVLGNVVPLFDPNGKPSGAVAAFVDITERKRMEAVQQKNQIQMATQRHLLQIRENERVQIAREIHDGPLQTLVAMILDVEFFKEGIGDLGIKTEFETLASSLRSAIQELRQVISELRPPISVEFGLVNAIRDYAAEICEKSPLIELDLHFDEGIKDLRDELNLALYRICQETLQNIIRHADATKVSLYMILENNQILLRIKDNGVGFSVPNDFVELTANKHYGLAGITERAEAVGGTVQIVSKPGKGTEIMVSVPYEQA